MTVDTKKLFNHDLPEALARNAEDAKTIGAKFQLNVTGMGEWFIDASPTGPACRGGAEDADVTITIAEEDFQTLVDNPQANAMQLFFRGKLKITGNRMLAMKLNKLFDYR